MYCISVYSRLRLMSPVPDPTPHLSPVSNVSNLHTNAFLRVNVCYMSYLFPTHNRIAAVRYMNFNSLRYTHSHTHTLNIYTYISTQLPTPTLLPPYPSNEPLFPFKQLRNDHLGTQKCKPYMCSHGYHGDEHMTLSLCVWLEGCWGGGGRGMMVSSP